MFFVSILISILIGLVSGTIYGLFFLATRRRVFQLSDSYQTRSSRSLILTSAGMSMARMMAFGLFVAYLLLSPSITFILILPCFLIAFWLTILTHKARQHGRF